MTYKELYLKEHPECKIGAVVGSYCPEPFQYGKCPRGYRDPRYPNRCVDCWNQEIPEEKSDVQKTVEQLQAAFDPVRTAAAKGGEALKKLSNKIYASQKIDYQEELKNIEDDEKVKSLKHIFNENKETFEAVEKQYTIDYDNIPQEVVDELCDVGLVNPISSEELRKLGPSPVPVYYECPHYDERTETCRDHMDHERCVCGGDMIVCDFFPAKREHGY